MIMVYTWPRQPIAFSFASSVSSSGQNALYTYNHSLFCLRGSSKGMFSFLFLLMMKIQPNLDVSSFKPS